MIKVDIISGFLGAGKTTLIKKLFESSFKKEKVALIENEFGEIGIDGTFLKNSGIEIKEINSGCICCSLVGNFEKSLEELIEKYNKINNRILNLEPLMMIFLFTKIWKYANMIVESYEKVTLSVLNSLVK